MLRLRLERRRIGRRRGGLLGASTGSKDDEGKRSSFLHESPPREGPESRKDLEQSTPSSSPKSTSFSSPGGFRCAFRWANRSRSRAAVRRVVGALRPNGSEARRVGGRAPGWSGQGIALERAPG